MNNPIDEAVEAYRVALRGHHGFLHLHLAQDFADGFIDPGEGHEPIALREVLTPEEEAGLRGQAMDAFLRAGRGEELRFTADLEHATRPVPHPLYQATGSAQQRFDERLLRFNLWRRGQGRLRGAASGFFAVAFVVALVCFAALPVAFERSDSDSTMLLLGVTPLALPWLALVVPIIQFRALGSTTGMGAAEWRPGGHFFTSNSTKSTIGRSTMTAWLGWAGAYAAVVGTVVAVALYVATIEDDWLGQPNTGEALGTAFLGAAVAWGSTALAVVFTWLLAMFLGLFAVTLAPEHDAMFESRDQRTLLRLIIAAIPTSLINVFLHPAVYDTSWWPDLRRRDWRWIEYTISDWQTGPAADTSALLVGGYWLSIVVALGLMVAGIVFGVRDRIRRRGASAPATGATPTSVDAPVP